MREDTKNTSAKFSNWCKPIKKRLQIDGFTISRQNYKTKKVLVASKGWITSKDDSFISYINSIFKLCGIYKEVNNVLIKVYDNYDAEIYIDNFPITTNVIIDKPKKAGTVVFDNEIEDIISVSFKDSFNNLTPKDGDKIICLLRHKFQFILFWDLSGKSKADEIQQTLGALLTRVSFSNFTNFFNSKNIETLVKHGWYPFAGLSENELNYIITKRGKPTKTWLKGLLTEERLASMFKKWVEKTAFKEKSKILESGINNFIRGDYIASIKTLISEIEGLLSIAYKLETNKELNFKDECLCEYIKNKTSNRTLHRLNSSGFIDYIDKSIYKKGMKKTLVRNGTRHTVTHGRATIDAYNLERNIQVILTINQLFYYL